MEPTKKEVSVAFVRHYTLVEHTCPVCNTVFTAPRLRVYCSPACTRKAAWERHGAEWNANRKARRKQVKADRQEAAAA